MQEVELDVAAPLDQQGVAVRPGPGLAHAAAYDPWIGFQEGAADILDEAQVRRGVARGEVVEEDAARAARLVAVGQEEIAVAPRLEARVVRRIVPVAGGLEGSVQLGCVLDRLRAVELQRRQVAAAAEPALPGHQHARIEMRGRDTRAVHVGNQADAAGPEARILGGTGDPGREFRREVAEHGGDVDAHFLEDAAAHDAHHPATAAACILGRALPGGALEAPGRTIRTFLCVLDRFEAGAKRVAQALEPNAGSLLQGCVRFGSGCGLRHLLTSPGWPVQPRPEGFGVAEAKCRDGPRKGFTLSRRPEGRARPYLRVNGRGLASCKSQPREGGSLQRDGRYDVWDRSCFRSWLRAGCQ
ncbi:protein of unknown function [Rhodovastum atsumiense]|nr:protein of unknown function [Rhodovastum atsumiense]